MAFITPFLCDRRVYDKRGKWKSPNNDTDENIFYFIKEPLTFTTSYASGREELRETLTICAFGGKPFCINDLITLEDGNEYRILNMTTHYFESNILIKDMLKPRIECMDLVLG